jgi:hypothetical protein
MDRSFLKQPGKLGILRAAALVLRSFSLRSCRTAFPGTTSGRGGGVGMLVGNAQRGPQGRSCEPHAAMRRASLLVLL